MSRQYYDIIDTACYTSKIAMGGAGTAADYYYGIPTSGGPPTSGTIVCSIQAWKSDKALRAIEVELSDRSVSCAGNKEGAGEASEKFYLALGEKLTSLTLWGGDFKNGRATGIELSTDQKRSFHFTVAGQMKSSYEPEIGSGILVGIFGRSGRDVDSLGFALLRRVRSAQLIGVEYPDIATKVITTQPRMVKAIRYDNSSGTSDQSFTFSGSAKVETTRSWSATTGLGASVSITVSAGAPLFGVTASATASLEVTSSTTHERSTREITDQSFEFPITVPAYHSITAVAILNEGNIDLDYKGTMKFALETGKEFSYPVKGTYKGVAASEAVIKTT